MIIMRRILFVFRLSTPSKWQVKIFVLVLVSIFVLRTPLGFHHNMTMIHATATTTTTTTTTNDDDYDSNSNNDNGHNDHHPNDVITTTRMPKLMLTKNYPQEYLFESNTYNASCLNLDDPDFRGGWGNVMFQILYAFITSNKQPNLPCIVEGGLGNVITNMFTNLVKCNVDTKHHNDDDDDDDPTNDDITSSGSKCVALRSVRRSDRWGKEIIPLVKDLETIPQRQFLLQLNETYVVQTFFSGSLEKLRKVQRSCGIHVRFGDAFWREHNPNRRRDGDRIQFPQCKSNHNIGNMEPCFKRVSGWIDTVCPPNNVHSSIFFATDHPSFREYFIDVSKQRGTEIIVTDISNANGTMLHINDIHNDDTTTSTTTTSSTAGGDNNNNNNNNKYANPHFLNLLSDWVSLGLANNTQGLSRSTFVQTATLGLHL